MNEIAANKDYLQLLGPASEPPQSFWERVAETRWGKYVTTIERRAIVTAHNTFAAPGVGLEVGCEAGRWCQLLSERGWQMIGTETNPQVLKRCQERNPSVRCICVDPQQDDLPIDSHSIDLLLCIEVPATERQWFPGEASRVLKPGGIFVGSFLNLLSWRGLAAKVKAKITGKPHYYVSSYASFRRSLRRNGFKEHGYCWMPFGRLSNAPMVPLAVSLERAIGLRHLPILSPWIMFSACRE